MASEAYSLKPILFEKVQNLVPNEYHHYSNIHDPAIVISQFTSLTSFPIEALLAKPQLLYKARLKSCTQQ